MKEEDQGHEDVRLVNGVAVQRGLKNVLRFTSKRQELLNYNRNLNLQGILSLP